MEPGAERRARARRAAARAHAGLPRRGAVINPIAIEAENFHRYPELAITLPTGIAAIVGPNGAGKSSLLEAFDVALFGGLKDHVTHGASRAHVCLEFDHRGHTYRVRRGVKNGKPTLDLERWKESPEHSGDDTGPEWMALTRENVSATQAHLEELLGISRDTLRASSLLMQNDGAAFTAAKPAKRKELLCDALGLDIWPRLQARTREELRTVATDLAVAQATAERLIAEVRGRAQLEHDIAETEGVAAEEQVLLSDAEADLARAAERYQDAREHAARRQAADAEMQTALGVHATLQTRSQEALKAAHTRVETAADLAKMPTPDAVEKLEQIAARHASTLEEHRTATLARESFIQEIQAATLRRNDLLGRASELNEQAEQFRMQASMLDARPLDDGAACDRCGQQLDLEARERALKSYADDAAKLDAEATGLDTQAQAIIVLAAPDEIAAPLQAREGLERTNNLLADTRAVVAHRAVLEERIRQCDLNVASGPTPEALSAAREALESAQARVEAIGAVPDVPAIEEQGRQTRATIERHRAALAGVREQLARLRTRLEQISAQEAELATSRTHAEQLQARTDLLKRAETAYGPAGIPTLVLENAAIPQIETEANRFMQALGWSYRIRLDTQRELASRDGLRESLDIIVETQLGEQTWERCSGGEQMRVNLALRLAVAALIATRKGVEVKLLALDEPGDLDADGFQRLVDLLHDLEQRGVFQKILLVSHHPDLKHAFEQVIEVTGGGDSDAPSTIAKQIAPVAA